MNLISSLTAVFGRGRELSDGIIMFGTDNSPIRISRWKAVCYGCGKKRVVGQYEHGGDAFLWCYHCANDMYGSEYPSGNLSRRAFHARCRDN